MASGQNGSGPSGSSGGNAPGQGQVHDDCGAALHSIAPDPRECQVINENDGVLEYGPGWDLSSGDPNGESLTSHSTTVDGAHVEMQFTGEFPQAAILYKQLRLFFSGTSIVVFGTVQQSNQSFPPPNASYSIDGRPAFEFPLPTSAMCIPNQQLFHSPSLHPGQHNLTITVTTAGTPYVLDYLWVCNPSPAPSLPRHDSSHTDAIIVGSVLGGAIFLFGLAAVAWFCIRRQRKARQHLRKLHISASPVSSWLHRQSNSAHLSVFYVCSPFDKGSLHRPRRHRGRVYLYRVDHA